MYCYEVFYVFIKNNSTAKYSVIAIEIKIQWYSILVTFFLKISC